MIICFVLYASLRFVESEGSPVSRYKTYGIFHFHEGMPICRFHELSHSHASLLIEMGFSALAVADRLGHEKVETTLNTYSHLFPHKRDEVAEKLQELK